MWLQDQAGLSSRRQPGPSWLPRPGDGEGLRMPWPTRRQCPAKPFPSPADIPVTYVRSLGRLHRHLGGLMRLPRQTLEFLQLNTASAAGHQHRGSAGSCDAAQERYVSRADVLTQHPSRKDPGAQRAGVRREAGRWSPRRFRVPAERRGGVPVRVALSGGSCRKGRGLRRGTRAGAVRRCIPGGGGPGGRTRLLDAGLCAGPRAPSSARGSVFAFGTLAQSLEVGRLLARPLL